MPDRTMCKSLEALENHLENVPTMCYASFAMKCSYICSVQGKLSQLLLKADKTGKSLVTLHEIVDI